MNRPNEVASQLKMPATPPRLIDVIGLPTSAQARRLVALLGLVGDLPQSPNSAADNSPPDAHAA